jgi:hypothetical protein
MIWHVPDAVDVAKAHLVVLASSVQLIPTPFRIEDPCQSTAWNVYPTVPSRV